MAFAGVDRAVALREKKTAKDDLSLPQLVTLHLLPGPVQMGAVWQYAVLYAPLLAMAFGLLFATAPLNRVRTARTRIETVAVADTEISANITFQIGNATRMDCADPSTNLQPGNAPCFDPQLRTPAA